MQTPLDLAHGTMMKDESAALSFYARLAEAELFMLLEAESGETSVEPLVLETSDGAVVLVFDTEDRMAAFSDEVVPYLSLSGRRIAQMLAGQNIGLGLNLGVAPSAIVLPAEAIDWLAETLAEDGGETQDRPVEITPPVDVPSAVITALDGKLANMAGVVGAAFLVSAAYKGGKSGNMLALIDVPQPARTGVFEALSEALQLSGAENTLLDIAFLEAWDDSIEKFARVGLGFDIPELVLAPQPEHIAPGTDPNKPPILR